MTGTGHEMRGAWNGWVEWSGRRLLEVGCGGSSGVGGRYFDSRLCRSDADDVVHLLEGWTYHGQTFVRICWMTVGS